MAVDAAPTSIYRFPVLATRRTYFVLALGFAAFAVYGSLLPFRLQPMRFDEALESFGRVVFTLNPTRVSRTDMLANALLFVPIGFTLAGSVLLGSPGIRTLLLAPLVILPFSLSVSLLAEFLQMFAMRRVPSNIDIWTQTAGTFVGVAAWALIGNQATRWINETVQAHGSDRLKRALIAYTVLWALVNLAPFDISLDLGELAARVRSGKVALVGFAPQQGLARSVWDGFAEVISAVPIGVAGAVVLQSSRVGHAGRAALGGAMVVAAVETAQIFIRSHAASGTDVLFGCAGVALGVSAGRRRQFLSSGTETARPSALWWPAVSMFAIWCVVLCAYHWLPYDFELNTRDIRNKLARISFLPLAGYGAGSALNALNDILTKLALALPLGLCAAQALRYGTSNRMAVTLLTLTAAAMVFAAIEAGQFFLPRRVPDPSDVMTGVAGTWVGLTLGYWLRPSSAPHH
jgi:glycopeptide antibiotics resistance protein